MCEVFIESEDAAGSETALAVPFPFRQRKAV